MEKTNWKMVIINWKNKKEKVDFYVAGGRLKSAPSTMVEIKNGKINLIREGKLSKKLKRLIFS